MAASSYDEALRRVLKHEGGYSNDPGDPGGPTKYGITIFDARAYWRRDATAADVRAMPLDVAKRIYQYKYWNAMRCSELPAGVDYAVFDYGVNSGIGRAARVLQRLLGVRVDGVIGKDTISAAERVDAAGLIKRICEERLRFLQGLRTWSIFGRGWGRRVREVRAAALAMTDKHTAPPLPDRPHAEEPPQAVSRSIRPATNGPPSSFETRASPAPQDEGGSRRVPAPQPGPSAAPVRPSLIAALLEWLRRRYRRKA
jgi:lysozyme family protein